MVPDAAIVVTLPLFGDVGQHIFKTKGVLSIFVFSYVHTKG